MRSYTVEDATHTEIYHGFNRYTGDESDFIAIVQSEDIFEVWELDWQWDNVIQDYRNVKEAVDELTRYYIDSKQPFGKITLYSK